MATEAATTQEAKASKKSGAKKAPKNIEVAKTASFPYAVIRTGGRQGKV